MTSKFLHNGTVGTIKASLQICILLLFFSGSLQAGEHYVGPGGNATWSQCVNVGGPYCSPQTAMQNAVAGDTAYFRGGTYPITGTRTAYHGLLEPSNSGTLANPIIFMAYNNEIPIISVNCTSSDNQCVAIGTNSKDYITWDGFTITTSNNKAAGIFLGGQKTSVGPVFKNSIVTGGSLPVSTADNYDLTRMENTVNAVYHNNIISGLTSTNRASNPSNNACIKMYFNDNATITNNEIFNCPSGISAKANINNSSIRYNYIHDNYINMEIHVYNDGSRNSNNNTFDNNIFSNPGSISLNIQAGDSAVAASWDIHNNTFYSDGASGSFFRHLYLGATPDLVFYNNIIVGNSNQFSTVQERSTLASMDHNNFGPGALDIELRRYGNRATYSSLSSWQSSGELISSGNPGVGSTASDPLFVNGSGSMSQISDFSLATGSPSINTGRNGSAMGANPSLVGSDTISPPKPPIVQMN